MLVKRSFLCFIVLCMFGAFASNICFSQNEYTVSKFDVSNGLPSEKIYDIAEDSLGNLYLATNRGIVLYDGYRFIPLTGTRSATQNILYTKKCFYAFYSQLGIIKFKNVLDTFSVFRSNNFYDADPNDDQYYQLYLDAYNHLWCVDINNIKYYSTEKKDTALFLVNATNKVPLDNTVFCEPKSDELWSITSNGIFVYEQRAKQLHKINNGILNDHFATGLYDRQNTLYLSTTAGKIFRYNILTNKVDYLPSLEHDQIATHISLSESNGQQQLIISTDSRLYLFDEKLKKYTLLYEGGSARIQCVHVVKSLGIIWLATTRGLVKISHPYNYLRVTLLPDSLQDNVESIVKDGNGNIWVSYGDVLWKYQNNNWIRYSFPKKNVRCTHISFYRGQPLFATTEGIFILKENRLTKLLLHSSDDESIIKSCYVDTSNRLWIIPMNAPLRVFDMDTKEELVNFILNKDSIIKNNVFNDILENDDGKMWFAGWFPESYGVAYYDEASMKIKSLADDMPESKHGEFMGDYYTGLAKAKNGNLLFCGSGGWNLVARNGKILKMFNTELYNVASNMVQSISEDTIGNIWFATDEGLNAYIPNTNKVIHFGQSEGLPTDNLVYGYYQTTDNHLLIGAENSMVDIDQTKALQTELTGKLELTAIYINGKLSLIKNNEIHLNANENDIKIDFTTLNYSDNKVIYRYRFEGDTAWTFLGTDASLSLMKLSYGTYHIIIEAGDNLGNFQKKKLLITLKIPPPYYKTWWFVSLVFLFAAAVIFFAVRYYFVQQKIKHQLNERIKDARMQALRAQMNPHFIFNVLNSIESYIIENDSKTAAKLIQKFASLCRLILENSSQAVINAEREWEALKLYTEFEALRFPDNFNYSFTKQNDVALSKMLIPPMMVQPLIENAIHHGIRNSDKHNLLLEVEVSKIQETVMFVIKDNGIGLRSIQINEEKNRGLFVKQKSFGIPMILERINIINESLGKDIASFSLSNDDSITIATLVLPILN